MISCYIEGGYTCVRHQATPRSNAWAGLSTCTQGQKERAMHSLSRATPQRPKISRLHQMNHSLWVFATIPHATESCNTQLG